MFGGTFILIVRNIHVIHTCHRALFHCDLAFASSLAHHWVREAQHLYKEVSDHAPLSYPFQSLTPPQSLRLWHLSRFWALDTKIQEPLMEANYWVLNEDSTNKVMWDAFKCWVRGEYISCISTLQREVACLLEALEKEGYVQSTERSNYSAWQQALRKFSVYRIEQKINK